MLDKIRLAIKESIKVKELLLKDEFLKKIEEIADLITLSIKNGGKVVVFGNGGSASDAEHMAGELVGRFKKERKALPAISLTTNSSNITAIANDYSYDVVFKRQLEAFAGPLDVVIGISTSGKAKNVNEAMRYAKSRGIKTIALSGRDGGELVKLADRALIVPSDETPAIQEAHIMVIHIICGLVEQNFS